MNIIVVSCAYTPPHISGGDRIFLELCRKFNKENEVLILGHEETKKLCELHGLSSNFELIKYPKGKIFGIRPIRYILSTLLATIFILRIKKNYNIIISSSDFWPDLIPAFFYKLKNKIFWVSSFYLLAPNPFASEGVHLGFERYRNILYRISQYIAIKLIVAKSDLLLTCTSIVIKKFEQSYFKKRKVPTHLIFGGVEVNDSIREMRIKYLNSTEYDYDVVYMARFHPQKGPLEMLDIWEILIKDRPDLKLAMIGDGPLYDKVLAKVNIKKLENSVKLLGFLDGEDKNHVFLKSKVFAHPVIYDTGGLAPMEAMVFGLPAVSFDLEGLKEVYPSGMLKVSQFNKRMFAETLIELFDNKALWKKTSLESINLSEEWSWQNKSKQLLFSVKKLSS
jgi:glycosyltransferase involved in cell wall biosynthesis